LLLFVLILLCFFLQEKEDFKTHQLPLARIKKIMKSDEDVRVSTNLPKPVVLCAHFFSSTR
jgi:hypothetical protein